jgi:phage tail sheath gpL-like
MATVVVSIKTNKDHTQFKCANQKVTILYRLAELLKSQIAGSAEGAEVFVSTSSSDPVAATGTLTLTYGNISASDTVVVAGTTLTATTGSPTAVQFKKETDATVTATNLKNAINAQTALAKYLVATSALGVVTITAKFKGSIGNLITIVGSTGVVASAATLASGAGGPEGTSEQVR